MKCNENEKNEKRRPKRYRSDDQDDTMMRNEPTTGY